MKQGKHPDYQEVLFVDSATEEQFLCGTTLKPEQTAVCKADGKEYPSIQVPISSASHPFFTKEQKLVDTEGRVDKFNRRYGGKKN